MNYDWDFNALSNYWPALRYGMMTTLALTGLVVLTGTPIGILLAIGLRLTPRFLRWALVLIIDVIRSLPVLVLIFLCYYLLPSVFHSRSLSAFRIAWLSLALYLAVFAADVLRGSLDNVPRGYVDAGRALGLSPMRVFWRIELPWVVRTTLPTLALLWIGMLKNSSIASIIGVYELTHTAEMVTSNTFRSIETYSVVAAAYVSIIIPFSYFARRLEVRFAGHRDPYET